MAAKLTKHCYGKHRVRLSKVRRPRSAPPRDETHELVELAVDVELEGSFDAAYLEGDNRSVVATDTCKNTVYAIAKDDPLDSIESFAVALSTHFLETYDHISECRVAIEQRVWGRLQNSPHSFVATATMTPTAKVNHKRGQSPQVTSGVEHLLIAKTTESGFSNFHQSELRSLADTEDRILATEVSANWLYNSATADFAACRETVVDTLLKRFTDHYSRSVQETLYFMGQSVLEACDRVESVSLSLPNKHHILFDLSKFGRENENEVFVVTDEPFGYIAATVSR